MNWDQIYFAIFLMALVLSLGLTPLFRALAAKTSFYDIPEGEAHKLHRTPTPLLGGAALCLSWLLTVGIAFAAFKHIPSTAWGESMRNIFSGVGLAGKDFIIILLCALGATLLGLRDDRKPMKAHTKFLGQILIAGVTAFACTPQISLFIGAPWIGRLVMMFWILVIFNAINFLDNMDGLAAGTAGIAMIFFTAAAICNGQYFVAALGASLAGSTLGFWFYNHSPASIFMGDSGSHFLGYMLAVLSAKVTYFDFTTSGSRLNILIPIFILAVPLFDTLAVMAIRIKNHKPIYVGDHNHISHRFLHMGMTRKQAVLCVHLLEVIAGLGAMPLLWGDTKTCFLLLSQGCVILILLSLLQYFGRVKEEKKDEK